MSIFVRFFFIIISLDFRLSLNYLSKIMTNLVIQAFL